jgi:hypothetical protein
MKSGILQKFAFGVFLTFMPFVGGCLQGAGISAQSGALVAPSNEELQFLDSPVSQQEPGPVENLAETEVSDAPAQRISTEKPLPVQIRPTESLAEVIRLANSGVDQNVLLAYVTNASGTFSLGPEEIIYLNDIGVPATVVTTMMQHDHLMVENARNAAPPPIVPNSEPAPNEPQEPDIAAAPAEPGLPMDYVSDNTPAPPIEQPADSVFYDSLAPYGTWLDVGGYGRCWQPSVVVINHSWQPYCDRGHWVYSDCGWYWASDYSWGWAPFHYGRWFRHSSLGWCWQPDRVWGPSWVGWRYSNDYCGWAPLPPAAYFRPGLGFTYRGHSVGFSFNFPIAASCFTFVPTRNFCDLHVSRFSVHREQFVKVYNSTVAVNRIVGDNHRVINHGIPVDRITASTHANIRKVALRELNAPPADGIRAERLDAGGRTLTVFRPPVTLASRASSTPGQRGNNEFRGPRNYVSVPSTEAQAVDSHSTFQSEQRRLPPARIQSPPAAAAIRATPNNIQREPARYETVRKSSEASANGVARATTHVSSRKNSEPLIIRDSERGSQAAADSSASPVWRPSANQQFATRSVSSSAVHRFQTQSSSAGVVPRSVQGPPRFEHPSNYSSEAPARPEVQRWADSAPSRSFTEAPQRFNTVPSYQAPREIPRSMAAQPAQRHEMPQYHATESRSLTHVAPQSAPSPTFSANHSQPEKRGK